MHTEQFSIIVHFIFKWAYSFRLWLIKIRIHLIGKRFSGRLLELNREETH